MHVVLIHQACTLPGDPGGTRHYELAQHLARSGHQVTILASQVTYYTGTRTSNKARLVLKEQLQDGIAVWRCYTYAALHRSFLHRLFAYWSFTLSSFLAGLQVRHVDLVWGTSPPIFQGVTALLVARLKRVPFLFEVRDLWPDFAVQLGVLRQPLLIALSRRLEQFLYRHADRVLVNSPGFLAHVHARGVPPSRIALVANGVETAQFGPARRGEVVREEWGIGDRFAVLYAGAHGMANDLGTVLEAASLLRERRAIAFLLVGDGKEKANLMERAREMELDNVLFVPAQPKERMPDVLAAADVCLATLKAIPMFNTTYPNKVFDYMAAGRPTVLAIDGVIRQVIEISGGGSFVPPGDACALAEAVRRYYEDQALRQRQGRAARAYVVANFDRPQQACKFEALLRDMSRDERTSSPAASGASSRVS